MTTTPTGIPVTACAQCGKTHPVSRSHCEVCGAASAFFTIDGRCLKHSKSAAVGGVR